MGPFDTLPFRRKNELKGAHEGSVVRAKAKLLSKLILPSNLDIYAMAHNTPQAKRGADATSLTMLQAGCQPILTFPQFGLN
jgi:hypothetical protein